jgi:hypothetical protein
MAAVERSQIITSENKHTLKDYDISSDGQQLLFAPDAPDPRSESIVFFLNAL